MIKMNVFVALILGCVVLLVCLRDSKADSAAQKTQVTTKVLALERNVNLTSSPIQVIDGKLYYRQKFAPIKRKFKHHEGKEEIRSKITMPEQLRCETPNNDTGYCTSLEECSVLRKVKDRNDTKHFLQSSRCLRNGSTDSYCCGKFENFKYMLPKRPLPRLCGYEYINLLKKGRIFGGTEAKLGEFPWLARIIHTSNDGEKSVGCEGFLIHKRFILTAAHCVRSPRMALVGNITEVQLGEHNTQTEKDCNGLKCADPLQILRVKSIIPHPDYRHNSRDHHYDVALIYLKGEVKFSNYVQPICLSDKSHIPEAYWISGWGKTENGTYSNVKMKVALLPFDLDKCANLYTKYHAVIARSQFCAGGEENKDSCIGDSGGPLMFHDNENKWFAVGLVSYGVSCGMKGWPGVYTSIPFFYDWIVDQIIEIREPELLKSHENMN